MNRQLELVRFQPLGRVASSLHCICTAYYRAYFRIGMHECVYMHMHSVYVVYVVPMVHVGTCQGFIGVICSVRQGVLFWPAVQCSMQYIANMALHWSYCVVSSAAAVQGEYAMTKVTNLSH